LACPGGRSIEPRQKGGTEFCAPAVRTYALRMLVGRMGRFECPP